MQGRGGAADEAEQNQVQPRLEETIGAEKFLGRPYPQPRRSVSPGLGGESPVIEIDNFQS
jgi:hypothetical protein